MRRQRPKLNELTLDFGPFCHPQEMPANCLFQRVKSEMLKRRQRTAHRRKPVEYERLEASLQEKLKQKVFNKEEQRVQIVMLEKCKNYFQMRRARDGAISSKASLGNNVNRPQTSVRKSEQRRPLTSITPTPQRSVSNSFMNQLQVMMDDCGTEGREIKENMHLFTFYCQMMNRRLDGIRLNIQKKERMI